MLKVVGVKRERLSEMIAFRVYPSLYEVVTSLANKERRKLSEVELALFERGVAAFKRDGLLFEPEEVRKLPIAPANLHEGERPKARPDPAMRATRGGRKRRISSER
jgi:hypothetical protein